MRVLRVTVGAIALATLAALIVLWPGETEAELAAGLAAPTERAEVNSVTYAECPPPQPGTCGEAEVRIESGADEGDTATLNLGGGALAPELAVGDAIRVSRTEAPPADLAPGTTTGAPPPAYNFVDFERRAPMLWLAVAFAALVVLFGRLRGALSLLGLAASLALVVVFIVPAILDGTEPLAVAIVGSLAVMLVTISLAHGLGPKSLAAMLGTSVSLLLV
ncbi:MAG TPA: YibE/F family protein, partial [Solirubrobacterales bacterium]|nr:YibE/F family protein [Solirubrobacterales bacterium]